MSSSCTHPGLSILLLLASILGYSGVKGQVTCYHCVWMYESPSSTGALPSTVGVPDICRPQNFNHRTVQTEVCPQGCVTTILYTEDPDMPISSTTTTLRLKGKRNQTRWKLSMPPMAFFLRGCSKPLRPLEKPACEKSIYQESVQESEVFRDECFCTTDLCNGESSSWSVRLEGWRSGGIFTLGCLFIISGIINPTSTYFSSHFS